MTCVESAHNEMTTCIRNCRDTILDTKKESVATLVLRAAAKQSSTLVPFHCLVDLKKKRRKVTSASVTALNGVELLLPGAPGCANVVCFGCFDRTLVCCVSFASRQLRGAWRASAYPPSVEIWLEATPARFECCHLDRR